MSEDKIRKIKLKRPRPEAIASLSKCEARFLVLLADSQGVFDSHRQIVAETLGVSMPLLNKCIDSLEKKNLISVESIDICQGAIIERFCARVQNLVDVAWDIKNECAVVD